MRVPGTGVRSVTLVTHSGGNVTPFALQTLPFAFDPSVSYDVTFKVNKDSSLSATVIGAGKTATVKTGLTGFSKPLNDVFVADRQGGINFNVVQPRASAITQFDDIRVTQPEVPRPVPTPIKPSIGTLSSLGALEPTKPTIVITHGWQPLEAGNPATPAWVLAMQQDIHSESANVLTWTWPGAFDTQLNDAYSQVRMQGEALGASLLAVGPGNLKDLQFVGHSLGTLVNAYAMAYLVQHSNIDSRQFTILDSPFGSGIYVSQGKLVQTGRNLDEFVFRATLPKGRVQWVDNYYGNAKVLGLPTAFGGSFQIAGGYSQLVPGANHEAVHDWYQCTIVPTTECLKQFSDLRKDPFTQEVRSGFFWSNVGGGFNDRDRPPPQVWDPRTDLPSMVSSDMVSFTQWSTIDTQISGSQADLKEASSAYLWKDVTIPAEAIFLTFDFIWINIGDGDYLTLNFGDRLLFSFLGLATSGSELLNSGLIDISQFAGSNDQILFTLNSVGQANGEVTVDNLRFFTLAVPEPSLSAALFLGVLLLAFLKRKSWSRRLLDPCALHAIVSSCKKRGILLPVSQRKW